ncbi:hypothetical protein E4U41_001950 [Claviceps citrina]|nr:hypothetical protein E4U41_001950 [Claviceps citrina]
MLHKTDMEKRDNDVKKQVVRSNSAHHKALSRINPRQFGQAGNVDMTTSKSIPGPPDRSFETGSTRTNQQGVGASGLEPCPSTRRTSPAVSDGPSPHSRKNAESLPIYHVHNPEHGTAAVRTKKRIKSTLE